MSFMSSMMGGGGGGGGAAVAGDMIANQNEQTRLLGLQAKAFDPLIAAAIGKNVQVQTDADSRRIARNAGNPWQTTGYTGVSGSRTLGATYTLGT